MTQYARQVIDHFLRIEEFGDVGRKLSPHLKNKKSTFNKADSYSSDPDYIFQTIILVPNKLNFSLIPGVISHIIIHLEVFNLVA